MGKKKEFVIEYDFQSSPQLLFQYLSSPSGLSEGFSDDVNYRGEKYTFFWGESEEYARVLSKKNNEKHNLNTFKSINNSLINHGILVIDYLNVFKLKEELVEKETKKIGNIIFNIKRSFKDNFIVKKKRN